MDDEGSGDDKKTPLTNPDGEEKESEEGDEGEESAEEIATDRDAAIITTVLADGAPILASARSFGTVERAGVVDFRR